MKNETAGLSRTSEPLHTQRYTLTHLPTSLKPAVPWLEEGRTYAGDPTSPSQGALGAGVRLWNPDDITQCCVVAEEDLVPED